MPRSNRPEGRTQGFGSAWRPVGAVLAVAARSGLYVALALFVTAVVVGRSAAPPGDDLSTRLQVAQGRRPALLDGLWWANPCNVPRAFDPDSGAWVAAAFPDGDEVDRATVAPWVDAGGRSLVAGRWQSRDTDEEVTAGIACYRFPDGEVVGRVATDVAVVSPPCWFPDRSSRLLFPGADGVLYRVAFDESAPPAPVPLAWATGLPGRFVMIEDVAWPDDPRWGDRLLVALNFTYAGNTLTNYAGSQVWWLELDPGRTAILRAGRVTRPSSGPDPAGEERCPAVADVPGVGLVLAYVVRTPGARTCQVRLAELATDPATGAPVARPGTDRVLAEGAAFSRPVFSPDGRWVYALMDPLSPRAHMERFPVPGASPAAGPAAPPAIATRGPAPRPHA